MPIPKDLIGTKTDQCQCGRRSSIRHCPECGSTRVYGYAKPQFIEKLRPGPDGEPITVYEKAQLYRCQRCNHNYTDKDREYCIAPPVGEALSLQKTQALAQIIQTDADVPQSVKSLLPKQPKSELTQREAWHAFRRIEINFIGAYRDYVEELKKQGKEPDQTEREFVDSYLIANNITRVEEPPRENS